MKKLFLGLGLVAGSFAFAQSFGVKAGMNVSSISKDKSLSDTKSKIGFNAGVFMNLPVAESFSIQPEVLYNDLGAKSIYKVLGKDVEYSTKLGYVTVPVMIQYNATPQLYLEAGPEVGFLVNTQNKLKAGNNSGNLNIDKKDFNNLNFGVGIGAGYYLASNIGLTARYTAGVTKIGKDNKNYSGSKNNVLQVGLAYKF